MASRRKSTIPCMVPPQEKIDSDQEVEDVMDITDPEDSNEFTAAYSEGPSLSEEQAEDADIRQDAVSDLYLDLNTAEGGYECKYCSFQTSELNLFTIHVDTEHPDVILNTSYVCVECDFHTKSYDTLQTHNARLHPGEDNFTRTMVKRNNETIFQQTVNDLTFDGSFVKVEEDEAEEMSHKAIPLSKTPIMRIKSRPEPKKFGTAQKLPVDCVIKVESDDEYDESQEPPTLSPAPTTPAACTPRLIPVSTPVQLQAIPQGIMVNSPNMLQIKGGSTGGGPVLPPGTLAQVLSALQTQQSTQTQLLIPISSIPTYNNAMDNNVLLVSAYNRFPYPSVSEIIGLSAQTKFSEEQIKVWFSAQRLKHGVSWTPEEVEEARRKKFNGTVQTVPQTITVIPANIGAATNGLQSIFQTCQIVGQPGLVLTQVAGSGSTVPVASPITLTVAGVPGNQPKAAEASAPESNAEVSASSASMSLSLDAAATKPKKSKEQLAELKASYSRRQFATEEEISRLMEVTKLSKRAIKKWFSDTRYNQRNSRDHHSLLLSETSSSRAAFSGAGRGGRSGSTSFTENISSETLSDLTTTVSTPTTTTTTTTTMTNTTIVIDSSDDASDSSPTTANAPGSSASKSDPRLKFRHAFPDFTPQKFKEKTTEQLNILESSFQKSEMPSDEELSRLRAETKLTRREVDAWFSERRKTPSAALLKDSDTEMEEKVKQTTTPLASPEGQTTPPVVRKILKKTPEQLHILKKAFVRTQWPTSEEYDQMAEETGLPRTYIVNWFGDTRYACKNSNLKWYYLYQSGKVDEALNGGGKKKSRKRFRSWSRRTRRSYPCKRSPQGCVGAIKVKSGKTFLKDYYLKHKALSEKDLDDLVSKSKMSYEQVRDWFSETIRKVEEGKEPFSDEEGEEDDEEEEEDELATAECRDSEGEIEAKEEGTVASNDECVREEEEEEAEEEDPNQEDGDAVQEESEGLSHSQPLTEEQT
ncbi:zinc fingers and homeoboxes protein 1-like [Girardinichthys multiradiatus]|uniref:zinc fingers and homeoboxes protein 1-like n=1 Tax=Girardinichthys multiradiatus TaxID=208333 RepID=UPI001FAB3A91|nr:zinc fingers and homeoboxes protein 1-like [Girardinichthys multiradiatus]XP_047239741.1 zinc fingers and homeoboxes protein 1-like [Girardinichthys multiradiatus]XP_047239742.1 zinc fingers and homeoboxes protein 1-like [Girardinichthys multiradiatus]XP_047239743.1 zinc fingers and homeoboxes protein 1-like [Girardinichthys multiradiatus]